LCPNGSNIKISDSEQISQIIILIKEQLGDKYTVAKHKTLARKELLERKYDEKTIQEWIKFIE